MILAKNLRPDTYYLLDGSTAQYYINTVKIDQNSSKILAEGEYRPSGKWIAWSAMQLPLNWFGFSEMTSPPSHPSPMELNNPNSRYHSGAKPNNRLPAALTWKDILEKVYYEDLAGDLYFVTYRGSAPAPAESVYGLDYWNSHLNDWAALAYVPHLHCVGSGLFSITNPAHIHPLDPNSVKPIALNWGFILSRKYYQTLNGTPYFVVRRRSTGTKNVDEFTLDYWDAPTNGWKGMASTDHCLNLSSGLIDLQSPCHLHGLDPNFAKPTVIIMPPGVTQQITQIKEEIKKACKKACESFIGVVKCECGVAKVGGNHSDWCPCANR